MKRNRTILILGVAIASIWVTGTYLQETRADTGITAKYNTALSFQNADTASAHVKILYYPEGTSVPVAYAVPGVLAPNAAKYVTAATVGATQPRDSWVVVSDQHIVSTLGQVAQPAVSPPSVKIIPVSNGFSNATVWDTVPTSVLLPTVLKNKFSTTSKFRLSRL